MTSKKTVVLAALSLPMMAGVAFAGGLDRTTYSPNILFEQGNYIEGSYARVRPDLTGDLSIPPLLDGVSDIAPDYSLLGFGAKFDLTDRVAVAFQTFDAVGSDISYDFGTTPPFNFYFPIEVAIDGRAYVGTAKFDVGGGFSVYGGVKHMVVGGEASNLLGGVGLVPFLAAFASDFEFETSHGTGYIAGVAYSKPEIALRVSFTYESAFDISLDTRASNPVYGLLGLSGSTTATIPEAWELYFQTGIAPGTLLFGSVRHTSWSDANIVLFDNVTSALGDATAITDFSDVMTYNLGIGRQVTDRLSVSLSGTYEPSDGKPSTLQPTGDKRTLGVGFKYKVTENIEFSSGLSYTWLGDNETNLGLPPLPEAEFKDNSAWAWGTKVGIRF